MKTNIFFYLFLTCGLMAMSNDGHAQFRIGPTVNLGFGSGFGIGGTADIYFNENISISPGVIFFFPDDLDQESEWAIDGDLHYYMELLDGLDFYGIGGIQITRINVQNETELGINAGAGLDVNIQDNMDTFFEAKYSLLGGDQFILTAGIYFLFGGS